jgi:hypothetical protein
VLAGQGEVARIDVVADTAQDDAHVGRGVFEELGVAGEGVVVGNQGGEK